MNFRRASGYVLLSVIAVLTMYACGGGGGGGSSAPPTPTVSTSAAVPAIENATLVGEVNPHGLATQVWFEYGTASDLSGATSTSNNKKSAGDNSATVQITYLVPGLSPWTDYYYRVVAESSAGPPQKGNIVKFKTNAPTPIANTLLPNQNPGDNNVGLDQATLKGEVDPNGMAVDVGFQISISPTLSENPPPPIIPVTTLTGVKGTLIKVSYTKTGLERNLTYYYRVVAKNAGILLPVNGSIKSFKTLPNPLPVANAGPDNTVGPSNISVNGGAITGLLDGSKSFDTEAPGTITSYNWVQIGTPAVTINSPATQTTTFLVSPLISVPYPVLDLNFQLTVGSSRGPVSTPDTTKVSVKWGFLDDFTTDTTGFQAGLSPEPPNTITGFYYLTTGGYTVRVYHTPDLSPVTDGPEGMNYLAAFQLAEAYVTNNHGVQISHNLPSSDQGVFSMVFYPVRKALHSEAPGFSLRLSQDANNYYEITNGEDDGSEFVGTPTIKKVVAGTVVDSHVYTNRYTQDGGTVPYPIKVRFSPTQITWEAYGMSPPYTYVDPTLPSGRSISVNKVTMDFWLQVANIDEIRLEPLP